MGNFESLDCLAGTAPDVSYFELLEERDTLEVDYKYIEDKLIESEKKMDIMREKHKEMHSVLLKEKRYTEQLQKRNEKLQRRLLSVQQEFRQMHHQPILQKREKPLMTTRESASMRNIKLPTNTDEENLQPVALSCSVSDGARNVANPNEPVSKIRRLSHQRSNTDPSLNIQNTETDKKNIFIYVGEKVRKKVRKKVGKIVANKVGKKVGKSKTYEIDMSSNDEKEMYMEDTDDDSSGYESKNSKKHKNKYPRLSMQFQPRTAKRKFTRKRSISMGDGIIRKSETNFNINNKIKTPLNRIVQSVSFDGFDDIDIVLGSEKNSSESELDDDDVKIEDAMQMNHTMSFQKMYDYGKTMVVDTKHDPDADAKQIYGWIHYTQQTYKGYFKVQLAEILTARDSNERKRIIDSYQQRYSNDLLKDITKKLRKGQALKLIAGLLMTPAEYDALLVANAIKKLDITRLAEIICTRSVKEMKAIEIAYKKKEIFKLRLQLVMVAGQQKKTNMKKVFEQYFNYTRVDTAKPDMIAIAKDIEFLQQLKSRKIKANEKFLLSMIFINNNDMHIRILAEQWKIKSGGNTLESLIKHNFFKLNIIASTTGKIVLARLRYAIDPDLYFANKLKEYGTKFHHNRREIGEIFVSRFEKNLSGIQVKFTKLKLGDGKSLPDWIELQSNSSKFGFFLCQILQNSIQFSQSNMNSSDHKLGKLL